MDPRQVLDDVARLGGFFTVRTDPAESVDPTWRPMRELYTDPEPLRARIAYVRRALESDERVAASIAFQGLAAVLVSAPLAAVVVHRALPALTADALHWRPVAGGPWPLWCGAVGSSDPAGLADLLVDGHLRPLIAAVRAQVPVSERLLWGNAASAVAAAKRLIGVERPDQAERAAAVAARLLRTGPLAGTGDLLPPSGPDRIWSFRRRSCCMYYRVAPGAYCGDCVLSPAGRRRS